MSDKWWHSFTEGECVNAIILQFDLGSHTKAAKEMDTDFQAFAEFKEFGRAVEKELSPLGFDCLHWLGDGGLFAKRYNTTEDANSLCAAADAAFQIFQAMWGAARSRLTLRITATWLHGIFISKDAGYWYSLGLNQFLKNERLIGQAGAFNITDELFRKMDYNSACFARFKDSTKRRIDTDEGITFISITDCNHRHEVKAEADRFQVWVTGRTWPQGIRARHSKWVGTTIGDSLILGSALGKSGYDYSELIQLEPRPGIKICLSHYNDRFEQEYKKISHLMGKKACVRTYMPPLSDDPVLRIKWEMVDYARARAFHAVLEDDVDVWNCYSPNGTDADLRLLPGILVTHNILILSPREGERYLLLAHRKKGCRPGGYYNNCWSASFEEQYFPVESVRDGRKFVADPDLKSTVLRGAKEELLGEKFLGYCSVSLHAIQIETLNLNLGVLGVIILPGISFQGLASMWQHPDTIDRDEHDAIVALPFRLDVLERCLASDRLPLELWNHIDKAGRDDLNGEDHSWHPTSKARLALSLWILETGQI